MENEAVAWRLHAYLRRLLPWFDLFGDESNGGQQFSTIQIGLWYSGDVFWSILALQVPW